MKYTIEMSTKFKKDYKLAKKRGYDTTLLRAVIACLPMVKRCRRNIVTTL